MGKKKGAKLRWIFMPVLNNEVWLYHVPTSDCIFISVEENILDKGRVYMLKYKRWLSGEQTFVSEKKYKRLQNAQKALLELGKKYRAGCALLEMRPYTVQVYDRMYEELRGL